VRLEINRVDVLNKEIDLIQACISRMSQNSFIVKGWLITLVAVVLALLPESFSLRGLCIVGFTITICFWFLDGFFLKMEKLYRWKYEWVIKNRIDSELEIYDLNPYNSKMWIPNNNGIHKNEPKILRVMFTKTLCPMYGTLLVCIFVTFVNSFTCWF